jgi:ribose transport system substrate-binding protein
MPSRKLALVAPVAALALAVTACGSDSDSTSSTTTPTTPGTSAASTAPTTAGTSSASLDAAKANAEKFTVKPTAIKQTKPLTKVPPKGKKVGFVVCADPTCVILGKHLKAATDKLGWELTTVNATATNPGAAIQQLVDAGVDYVAETGVDTNAFQSQYALLKEKKIPLFQCYGAADIPAGESNGIYGNCFDSSSAKVYAPALADWVITDSGGKAHTLIMDLPAFPILTAQAKAAKAQFDAACPDCKTDTLELTVNDLTGGQVLSNLTSYLQTHPDINYVYETYQGFNASGIANAVKSLGGGKIKIVGQQGAQAEMREIISGTSAAWTELPQGVAMWTMADQMARLSVGEWDSANEREQAVPPLFIVDTPEVAKTLVDFKSGWEGPDGYQDAYAKVWGL